MKEFMNRARNFLRSEDGPTATEYAVMLALIIVACLAAITTLSDKVQTTFENVASALPDGTTS
ncbi:MAG: Flp family type IVb pilin [Phycisphaerales bacterium]|nr:Flp family type IVb pilin [Phycisphaerales bacterium]